MQLEKRKVNIQENIEMLFFQGAAASFGFVIGRLFEDFMSRGTVSQWHGRGRYVASNGKAPVSVLRITSYFSIPITELLSLADGRSRASLEGATRNLLFLFGEPLFWSPVSR